jgi:hypothetical protein
MDNLRGTLGGVVILLVQVCNGQNTGKTICILISKLITHYMHKGTISHGTA